MAQAPEHLTAHERRIAELEDQLKHCERRIAKLSDEAEERTEERRKRVRYSRADDEDEIEEALEDEARNWTWALGAVVGGYVETYNAFARRWNKGVGELGADLAQLARHGFLRLARP